jgi:hypothetical protein
MPKRTQSQRTGSLGHRQAAEIFESFGIWITRNQDEDFGVDLELELSDPDPSAHFIKCQIKSTAIDDASPVRLENSFARYCCECRVPFILARVETSTRQLSYCWIQEFISRSGQEAAILTSDARLAIPATELRTLDADSNRQLMAIARGDHPYAVSSLVRGLLRIAVTTKEEYLLGVCTNILVHFEDGNAYVPPSEVVETALSLGDKIYQTSAGNSVMSLLLYLAQSSVSKFTVADIEKLVRRGESYSRSGVNVLSALYDEDAVYVSSLKLPELFADDWRVSYFCQLRERFPGRSFGSLLDGDYNSLQGYKVDERADVWDKSLTRGASALLDFVYRTDSS